MVRSYVTMTGLEAAGWILMEMGRWTSSAELATRSTLFLLSGCHLPSVLVCEDCTFVLVAPTATSILYETVPIVFRRSFLRQSFFTSR